MNTKNLVIMAAFNPLRRRVLNYTEDLVEKRKGVLYWMSRDQRVQDNWAMIYAQQLAMSKNSWLHVCFCLVPKFLEATIRHYDFMLKGLQEVEKELRSLNISFHLLIGRAKERVPEFVKENDIGIVVCDFSPLRVPMSWVEELKTILPDDIYYVQVDAHNIVPCWVTSDKKEYAARTIRRKIHARMGEFCIEYPRISPHNLNKTLPIMTDWKGAYDSLEIDMTVSPVNWAIPGTKAGLEMLNTFINKRLKDYATDRNDPNKNGCSNLSPWFHFGQLAPQRAALEVSKQTRNKPSVDAFIEESVIRSELADNFCFFNENYDSISGAADWAQSTLFDHSKDKREYVYSYEKLEEGKTHDRLWNAAQLQMVQTGKMHGYLRMYWAKKILEWTKSPEDALQFAIKLNDKYSLDGRDPNGYVGCMWSICGIHDQGFKEREVFGKIRWMSFQGCKRKFNIDRFVKDKYRWMEK